MQVITGTEKKVMAALTMYPELSGKELAELVGISQSSFLRSRKRLMEFGLIRHCRVPSFGKIGRGIIFSGFGVVKENTEKEAPGIKDIFFLASEKEKGFGIGTSRRYSDFYGLLADFRDTYSMSDVESFGFQAFPTEMTEFWRFMDAGPLMASELAPDIEARKNPNTAMKGEKYDFGRGEWEVYSAIIAHPEWEASVLADKLRVSRQKIYRLDARFREEGLYTEKIIPNFKALGYELIVFASWKMPAGNHSRIMNIISGSRMPWPILMLTTCLEGIMVAVFRNFRESRDITEKMAEMGKRMNFEEYRPNIMFMSLPDTRYPVNFDFSGMLGDVYID